MRDALSNVLDQGEDAADLGVDRILAAAFFRKRPLQAGTSARVIEIADRRGASGEAAMGLSGTRVLP